MARRAACNSRFDVERSRHIAKSEAHITEGMAMARRFTLLDAMTLVLSTALGLAYVRMWCGPGFYLLFRPSEWNPAAIFVITHFVAMFSLPWSLSVLALRLLPPRPAWQSLCRQPGTIASMGVGLAAVHALLANSWLLLEPSVRDSGIKQILFGLIGIPPTSLAIIVGWAGLAVSGGWGPTTDWVDRIGRWLGFLWIALFATPILTEWSGLFR